MFCHHVEAEMVQETTYSIMVSNTILILLLLKTTSQLLDNYLTITSEEQSIVNHLQISEYKFRVCILYVDPVHYQISQIIRNTYLFFTF